MQCVNLSCVCNENMKIRILKFNLKDFSNLCEFCSKENFLLYDNTSYRLEA